MKLFRTTVAIVVGTLALSTQVLAQEYTIRLAATAAPTDSDPEYVALKVFEQTLEAETDGKVDVQIYPANQLGGTREFTEAVSLGSIEMGNTGYDTLGLFAPSANVLALPYLHDSLEHYRAVIEGPIGDEINDKIAEQSSIRVVGVLWRGARQMMTGTRPVRTRDDLAGLRIRSPESPLMAGTVRAMGGTPVPMSWSEVYTALATGAVDGVENPLDVLAAGKMQEVQKYLSLTNHIFLGNALIMSEDYYQSLPDDIRAAVHTAGKAASDARLASLTESEAKSLEIITAAGVQVIDDLDTAPFVAAAAEVWQQFVDGSSITEELIERIRNF